MGTEDPLRIGTFPAPRALALAAFGGAGAALLAALAFQYLGGLAPCPLCIEQRYPHGVGGALALSAAFAAPSVRRFLLGLCGVVFLFGAGLALYHAGIEARWWQGPDTCVAPLPGALSTDALMARILETPVIRCDEVAWSLLGLSLAGWNGLISLGLAGLCALGWWRDGRASQSP